MTTPTLVVVGSDDARYRGIGEEVAAAMPRAELCVIPDAGHDPIGDHPAIVAAEVSAFLDRHR
jgi:pimeloyl-ACP methyl ester carboxylesterase